MKILQIEGNPWDPPTELPLPSGVDPLSIYSVSWGKSLRGETVLYLASKPVNLMSKIQSFRLDQSDPSKDAWIPNSDSLSIPAFITSDGYGGTITSFSRFVVSIKMGKILAQSGGGLFCGQADPNTGKLLTPSSRPVPIPGSSGNTIAADNFTLDPSERYAAAILRYSYVASDGLIQSGRKLSVFDLGQPGSDCSAISQIGYLEVQDLSNATWFVNFSPWSGERVYLTISTIGEARVALIEFDLRSGTLVDHGRVRPTPSSPDENPFSGELKDWPYFFVIKDEEASQPFLPTTVLAGLYADGRILSFAKAMGGSGDVFAGVVNDLNANAMASVVFSPVGESADPTYRTQVKVFRISWNLQGLQALKSYEVPIPPFDPTRFLRGLLVPQRTAFGY